MMIITAATALLPAFDRLINIDPISQFHRLPRSSSQVFLSKRRLQNLNTLVDSRIILAPDLHQPFFVVHVVDGLASLHDFHQQFSSVCFRVELRAVVGDIDALLSEQVLRSSQRVLQRLVGLVDACAQGLRMALVSGRRDIWVRFGLELQVLFAELAEVGREGRVWWWSARKCLGEDGVVCRRRRCRRLGGRLSLAAVLSRSRLRARDRPPPSSQRHVGRSHVHRRHRHRRRRRHLGRQRG